MEFQRQKEELEREKERSRLFSVHHPITGQQMTLNGEQYKQFLNDLQHVRPGDFNKGPGAVPKTRRRRQRVGQRKCGGRWVWRGGAGGGMARGRGVGGGWRGAEEEWEVDDGVDPEEACQEVESSQMFFIHLSTPLPGGSRQAALVEGSNPCTIKKSECILWLFYSCCKVLRFLFYFGMLQTINDIQNCKTFLTLFCFGMFFRILDTPGENWILDFCFLFCIFRGLFLWHRPGDDSTSISRGSERNKNT